MSLKVFAKSANSAGNRVSSMRSCSVLERTRWAASVTSCNGRKPRRAQSLENPFGHSDGLDPAGLRAEHREFVPAQPGELIG